MSKILNPSTDTLVKIIRSIENLSPDIKADKAKLIKNVWDKWEYKNKVVSERSKGKTFLEKYESVYGKYDNYRTMLPYSLDQDFKEKTSDLNACIGSSSLTRGIFSKIGNPLGLGAATAAAYGGGYLLLIPSSKSSKKINRRQFIKTFAGFGAGIGGLIGILPGATITNDLERAKENAIYLDNIYEKYINK
ncbi:hypothetical protein KY348_05755 [Candidatus Woesearchaeota archaeon]|nr:hypothetical protein [Candidatus Woesearchaeota archaeon]